MGRDQGPECDADRRLRPTQMADRQGAGLAEALPREGELARGGAGEDEPAQGVEGQELRAAQEPRREIARGIARDLEPADEVAERLGRACRRLDIGTGISPLLVQ